MYGEEGNRRTPLIVAIALGVFLIAGAAVFFLTRNGPQSPADVEALLERSPSDREAARALKANFPADYQRLLTQVAEANRTRGRAAASREMAEFMARFIRSKVNALLAAPDRELQRIGGAQVALVHALRDENVNLCADYSVRGLNPGARISAGTIALLSRLAVFIIEAARAGEQPGRTPRPTLSEADGQAWIAEMRAIDPAVARQIEGSGVGTEPPNVQCRAGVVLYEAVTRLPAARAGNVTAFLIRESLSEPAPGR